MRKFVRMNKQEAATLIFGLLLLKGNVGIAGNCDPIRLDAPGKSMEHVPVVDQGNVGICYAATASALVDAYRFSHPPPKGDTNYSHLTSYLEGAVGATFEDRDPTIAGFDECETIDYFRKAGSCDRKVVGGEEARLTLAGIEEEFIRYLQMKNVSGPKSTLIEQTFAQSKAGITCKIETSFPAAIQDSAGFAEELLRLETVKEFDLALTNKICVGHRQTIRVPACTKNWSWWSISTKTWENYRDRINERLNIPEPVQPVGISYCANVLIAAGYRGIVAWEGKNTWPKEDCQHHASTVIGRRPNPRTGRCEFLVQNSWGISCSPYSLDWQCEDGKIWVDANILSANVTDTYFLEN